MLDWTHECHGDKKNTNCIPFDNVRFAVFQCIIRNVFLGKDGIPGLWCCQWHCVCVYGIATGIKYDKPSVILFRLI